MDPKELASKFKNIIDSVCILVSRGSGDMPNILLRAGYELMLSLYYLLLSDTEKKAFAFLFIDTLNEIEITKDRINDIQNNAGFDNVNSESFKELHKYLFVKQNLLTYKEYSDTFDKYTQLKEKHSNPKWYQLYDPHLSSLKRLATFLNHQNTYNKYYKSWSSAVHGTDVYLGKITHSDNDQRYLVINKIRHPGNVQSVVQSSILLCLTTYKIVVENRIPEKKSEWLKWHLWMESNFKNLIGKNIIT